MGNVYFLPLWKAAAVHSSVRPTTSDEGGEERSKIKRRHARNRLSSIELKMKFFLCMSVRHGLLMVSFHLGLFFYRFFFAKLEYSLNKELQPLILCFVCFHKVAEPDFGFMVDLDTGP